MWWRKKRKKEAERKDVRKEGSVESARNLDSCATHSNNSSPSVFSTFIGSCASWGSGDSGGGDGGSCGGE